MCLDAVRKYGHALRFVKQQQTDQICLGAVKQNGFTLKFVKDQTEEICIVAIRNDIRAFHFTKIKY
jgi:hypothetical protein